MIHKRVLTSIEKIGGKQDRTVTSLSLEIQGTRLKKI